MLVNLAILEGKPTDKNINLWVKRMIALSEAMFLKDKALHPVLLALVPHDKGHAMLTINLQTFMSSEEDKQRASIVIPRFLKHSNAFVTLTISEGWKTHETREEIIFALLERKNHKPMMWITPIIRNGDVTLGKREKLKQTDLSGRFLWLSQGD